MARATFKIVGSIEENLLREFLQYLRDFDTAHKGAMHLDMAADAPTMSLDEAEDAMTLDPPLPYMETVRKRGN